MPVARRESLTPYWKSDCGRAVVYLGDCKKVMNSLEPNQFHSIVTDPPYGIEFMNLDFDAPWRFEERSDKSNQVKFQEWFLERAFAMLRVARSGAHLLSFGGTRMYHRMTCAVEDAGFELRDCIMWVYNSGMPKGTDVSQGIDKINGVKRRATGVVSSGNTTRSFENYERMAEIDGNRRSNQRFDEPVTEDAIKWNGWNTQLKPAYEPIIMARKELCGSVAQNTLKYECGGINVDSCRVGSTGAVVDKQVVSKTSSGSGVYCFNKQDEGTKSMNGDFVKSQKDGRHPANFIHDGSEEVLSLLPGEAGRFFYTAKADDSDRPHGRDSNVHPTVKPLDLCRYLVRLVTPREGVVLDPFMGSGSTLCAAIAEGMMCVGIEQEEKYADIAIGRINLALEKAR